MTELENGEVRSSPMDSSEDVGGILIPAPKTYVSVEVCQKSTSIAKHEDVRLAVERFLRTRSLAFGDSSVEILPGEEPYLEQHTESISITDTGDIPNGRILLFWQVTFSVQVYQLSEDGAAEEMEDDEEVATFQEWQLPARSFHGLWESLIYDGDVKQRLLRYATSALLFSDKGVNTHLISWNRVVLLFGPPGTGKTSLCKALAQKLSIRFRHRYRHAQLVEVNAHSLFSKWFSESGKLVGKLFQKIQELLDDKDSLVFILIDAPKSALTADEVESLTAARQAALSGSEPSDSIRVVNALLTQLDALKQRPNVLVLTTSNITQAIDLAFVDRADIKQYIGPPGVAARYDILRSCILELMRASIITQPWQEKTETLVPYEAANRAAEATQGSAMAPVQAGLKLSTALLEAAVACEGLSGRALRKLPFLAHATLLVGQDSCSCKQYIAALMNAAQKEFADRAEMTSQQAHSSTTPNQVGNSV